MSHRHSSVSLFVTVGLLFLLYGSTIIWIIRAAFRERQGR